MLVWPAARRVLMAKLRRVAMLSGPWPVWTLEASSAKVVSRTEWSLFSMIHCERAIFAMRSGEASRLVRSVMT